MANLNEMKDLIEKRNNIIEQAREIVNKAKAENRGLTEEEQANHQKAMKDASDLRSILDAEKAQADAELAQEELRSRATAPIVGGGGVAGDTEKRGGNIYDTDEYRDAFYSYLRNGNIDELRAINVDSPIAPTGLDSLIREKKSQGGILRPLATVNVSSTDRDIPRETSEGTSVWLSAGQTVGGVEPTLDSISFKANKMGRLIRLPKEVLQDEVVNLSGYIASAVQRSNTKLEEQAFAVGDGIGKPNGVVTSASVGKVAASGTTLTAAELVEFRRKLGVAYRANAKIMGNDEIIALIEALQVDVAQTQVPVFQPAVSFGQPDRLLGIEFVPNPWMVNSLAINNRILVYGDFSHYEILDRVGAFGTTLNRSDDRFFDTDEIAYLAISRLDGKLIDANAVIGFDMAPV